MVKKRAVLSGQGKALFFAGDKKEDESQPAAETEQKSVANKHPDLAKKVALLKELVKEFQKLADAKSFKSMRLSDIEGS